MVQSSLRIMLVNPCKKKDYVTAKIDQSAVQKGIAFDEVKQLILSIFQVIFLSLILISLSLAILSLDMD